jgi:hypothetical protein
MTSLEDRISSLVYTGMYVNQYSRSLRFEDRIDYMDNLRVEFKNSIDPLLKNNAHKSELSKLMKLIDTNRATLKNNYQAYMKHTQTRILNPRGTSWGGMGLDINRNQELHNVQRNATLTYGQESKFFDQEARRIILNFIKDKASPTFRTIQDRSNSIELNKLDVYGRVTFL